MKKLHTAGGSQEGNGFTLIEVIVVIAILGSLLALAAISARESVERYRVAGQTKEMFVDLLNTRVKAVHRNRAFFVKLQAPSQYVIYEDTHPFPDGDGDLQSDLDTVVAQKITRFPLTPHFGLGLTTFRFSSNGLVSLNGTIHFGSSVDPFTDCIKVFTTRILIGKWNGTSCVAQ